MCLHAETSVVAVWSAIAVSELSARLTGKQVTQCWHERTQATKTLCQPLSNTIYEQTHENKIKTTCHALLHQCHFSHCTNLMSQSCTCSKANPLSSSGINDDIHACTATQPLRQAAVASSCITQAVALPDACLRSSHSRVLTKLPQASPSWQTEKSRLSCNGRCRSLRRPARTCRQAS